jgi:hypothetical protein
MLSSDRPGLRRLELQEVLTWTKVGSGSIVLGVVSPQAGVTGSSIDLVIRCSILVRGFSPGPSNTWCGCLEGSGTNMLREHA